MDNNNINVPDPAFEQQASQQRGTLPIAPSCNPHLPAPSPVEISPLVERVAEHAGMQTNWKKTPIR
jgi:hypothetical protein